MRSRYNGTNAPTIVSAQECADVMKRLALNDVSDATANTNVEKLLRMEAPHPVTHHHFNVT